MVEQETINLDVDHFENQEQKYRWIIEMRRKFSIRKEFKSTQNIIHPDGSLNQAYFNSSDLIFEEQKKFWNLESKQLLLRGINEYGIGQFRKISNDLLPEWTPLELRQKTMRLIGRQNLQLYKGWKGKFKSK